jgi:hypothetical protein
VIREAKNLLERIIADLIPGVTVVKSVAGESREIMARKFPLVSLITNPGSFDDSEARTVRYFEGSPNEPGEPKVYRERYVRGHRNVPILIRCWAEGEDKADEMASGIIPEIPSQWEYDGFSCHVKIGAEEHSDHTGNLGKPYVSVIETIFTAAAARKPAAAPVIEKAEPEGGEYAGTQT